MALFVPMMAMAAPKNKKDEPIEHLTDAQIYDELKKLALVFEVARDEFVEEVDEKNIDSTATTDEGAVETNTETKLVYTLKREKLQI